MAIKYELYLERGQKLQGEGMVTNQNPFVTRGSSPTIRSTWLIGSALKSIEERRGEGTNCAMKALEPTRLFYNMYSELLLPVRR